MSIFSRRCSFVWLMIALCAESNLTLAQAATPPRGMSYFETEITQTQTVTSAQEYLKTLSLKSYAVKSATEVSRFEKTQQFLAQVKREASKRYASGAMSAYEFQDFGREIEYLTHNMNEYFRNQSAFERTHNRTYRTLARQNLNDANMTYARLSVITLASSRR